MEVCLKKSDESPQLNKTPIVGTAVVVATVLAAAKFSLHMNISPVVLLGGNMSSRKLLKPGDIVTSLSSKKVLVHDINVSMNTSDDNSYLHEDHMSGR